MSTQNLFGRTWSLQVLTAPSQGQQQTQLSITSPTDGSQSALKIEFDISMSVGHSFWQGDITIYNLNPSTIGLITIGSEVSLSVGYQGQGLTEIWRGYVFQPTFERQNVTDFKLTLHSILGLQEVTRSIMNVAVSAGATQWQIVQQAAQSAGIKIAHLDDQSVFTGQALPRGKTVFGSVSSLFGDIATQNNMVSFLGSDGLHMGKMQASSGTPDLTFAPPLGAGQSPATDEASITRSLIDSPQQTDVGVSFRVLLDPRLQCKLPPQQVKLDQAVIRQQAINYGQRPSLLTQDGVYMVAGIHIRGDSRGNEWYSEVIGVSAAQGLLSFLGGASI